MTKSKMTFVLGLAISMLMSTAVLAAEPATIAGGGTGGIGSDIATRAFNGNLTGTENTSPAMPETIAGGGTGGDETDIATRAFNGNLTGTDITSPLCPWRFLPLTSGADLYMRINVSHPWIPV